MFIPSQNRRTNPATQYKISLWASKKNTSNTSILNYGFWGYLILYVREGITMDYPRWLHIGMGSKQVKNPVNSPCQEHHSVNTAHRRMKLRCSTGTSDLKETTPKKGWPVRGKMPVDSDTVDVWWVINKHPIIQRCLGNMGFWWSTRL